MKWYNYLKPQADNPEKKQALLSNETFENFNLIICQKLLYLYFGKFDNYIEFAKHMLKNTVPENRCYYETILGDRAQKPYFDIEFLINESKDGSFFLPESEADESVKCLTQCIFEQLNEILETDNALKINKSHILVFTSHVENEGKCVKKSYHIVVDGFYLNNYKENKEFHDRVMKKMPPNWRDIVDHSMYKSLQQFRIVNNTKWKQNRFKTLNQDLTLNYYKRKGWITKTVPESDEHEMVLLLESSLITQTISCSILNCKPSEDKEVLNNYKRFNESGEELTEGFNPLTPDEIRDALALCYKYAGLEFGDLRFPYNYLKTVENTGFSALILLKRLKPSTCAICHRLHENENPFLIIFGTNRDVYLDCRRNSENKKLHVGALGPIPDSIKDIKDVVNEPQETVIKSSVPVNGFDVKDFINTFGKTPIEKSILPKLDSLTSAPIIKSSSPRFTVNVDKKSLETTKNVFPKFDISASYK